MILYKSPREVLLIKEAGNIINLVFTTLQTTLKPGMSTQDVDDIAARIIKEQGGIPTFKGYNGFKGNVCVSVNDTLIHGIPSKKEILKEGDIVSVDIGVTYKGYIADAARTFPVGAISEKAAHLIKICEESFWHALNSFAKPGERLGSLGHAIDAYGQSHGYTLTRDYTGHGVGRKLHEDPQVPNYGLPNTGIVLKEGMVLAIEPMLNEGKVDLRVMKDGWTVKTRDGKLACHYENTIVITKDGYEVLTMGEE